MASNKEYMYFISEQLSELEEISFKAMMGEYIICYRGKIVGGNIHTHRYRIDGTDSSSSGQFLKGCT